MRLKSTDWVVQNGGEGAIVLYDRAGVGGRVGGGGGVEIHTAALTDCLDSCSGQEEKKS